jgi:hypothetical protein
MNKAEMFMNNIMRNSQQMQNPIAQNTISLLNNKDYDGLEQLARNLCREKNINPDRAISDIKRMFNIG